MVLLTGGEKKRLVLDKSQTLFFCCKYARSRRKALELPRTVKKRVLQAVVH